MDSDTSSSNLTSTTTLWGLIQEANHGSEESARQAREAVLRRYAGAVYRYLLAALRDPHAADDLSQEFSLRFVRGDFRNADPQKGRFRDLIKTSLFHLIVDYQRRLKHVPQALPDYERGPVEDPPETYQSDEKFLESWRQQLLSQAWSALHEAAPVYYKVLRLRAEEPQLSSGGMAERLAATVGKNITADWVRQTLRRAREQFAELLLEELAGSLDNPTRERLEEELIDLRLLSYCQQILARKRFTGGGK
jgi:RNA polymerase sigma-70 factor (ECF subfamily)